MNTPTRSPPARMHRSTVVLCAIALLSPLGWGLAHAHGWSRTGFGFGCAALSSWITLAAIGAETLFHATLGGTPWGICPNCGRVRCSPRCER